MPEAVPACSGGDIRALVWWGTRADDRRALGRRRAATRSARARTAGGDGAERLMHVGEAATRFTPVEVWETKNPWLFERVELRADSGGPGRHRGGLGVDMFFHMLEDCWLTCGVERTKNKRLGPQGGGEGVANRARLRQPDGTRDVFAKATRVQRCPRARPSS